VTPISNGATTNSRQPSRQNLSKVDGKDTKTAITGLQRDFAIIQNIDFDEDPFGARALKQINFKNQGVFFPKKEFNSQKHSQQVLSEIRRRQDEMMEDGRIRYRSQFAHTLAPIVEQDVAVANMPKVRV
jgi:hypothetical protein